MSKIDEQLAGFKKIAYNPKAQLEAYTSGGKKAIGCFPYYVPEEIVHAAGMVPMGIWGAYDKPISRAKEYFAPFYCTIAQLGLEMGLDGTMDKLSGVIMPCCCDTLRPLTQNFRVSVGQKIPFIFLAHPQNRAPQYGIDFCKYEYGNVKKHLEDIGGKKISDDALRASIKVYNENRKARRQFVKLAGQHPDLVSAVNRSAVLKSSYFMLKEEHTKMLKELNAELAKAPASKWQGVKVVTSGIIADGPGLLKAFDDYKIAIAADDVAHESRGIRIDAAETGDPMTALAEQFAKQNDDPVLYDYTEGNNHRPGYVLDLVKKSGAKGVVVLMMTFCDPEEMEWPDLKKAMDAAKVPIISIGYDQQMKDFAQARTQLEAFRDILG
jgi:bcr-type benzoyl-CoA reductase subunit C